MINNDFYKIPYFLNYSINKNGVVRNDITLNMLSGSINPDGYCHYRLKKDDGNYLTIGRHRLLLLTFLKTDKDTDRMYVNHKNGIKGDDRLENLEWVTPTENVEHAGLNGFTKKCLPVETINNAGYVTTYPSAIKCAIALKLSKDTVLWRIKSNGTKVYEDGLRYRKQSIKHWPTTYEIYGIELRHVDTDKVIFFQRRIDAAIFLGIAESTLSIWIKNNKELYPGSYQIRTSNRPWDVNIPYDQDDIIVISGNVKTIYSSLTSASQLLNINKTTLHYRLNKNTFNPCKDGNIYMYLRDYKIFKNSPPN